MSARGTRSCRANREMLTGSSKYGNIRFNYITAPFESTARCGVRDEQTVFVSVLTVREAESISLSETRATSHETGGRKTQGLTYHVFVS
jgi:hypothetical protein